MAGDGQTVEDRVGGTPNGSQAPSPPVPVPPTDRAPDPDSDSIRYWDGANWTDHIAPETQRVPTELPPLPPPSASARVDLPAGAGPPVHGVNGGDDWAQRVHAALTRAQTFDSSDSWRDAMQAAAVVSAMAQTLLMAAEAREATEQLVRVARTATETDAEVRLAAEREARVSGDAMEAARLAAKAAAHAKQAAERSAKAVPGAAQAARVADEAAASAQRHLQGLDAIVAKARETNTSESWIEALQLAVGDLGDEATGTTSGSPRSPQSDGNQAPRGIPGA